MTKRNITKQEQTMLEKRINNTLEMMSFEDMIKSLNGAIASLKTIENHTFDFSNFQALEQYSLAAFELSEVQRTIALAMNEIAIFPKGDEPDYYCEVQGIDEDGDTYDIEPVQTMRDFQ